MTANKFLNCIKNMPEESFNSFLNAISSIKRSSHILEHTAVIQEYRNFDMEQLKVLIENFCDENKIRIKKLAISGGVHRRHCYIEIRCTSEKKAQINNFISDALFEI